MNDRRATVLIIVALLVGLLAAGTDRGPLVGEPDDRSLARIHESGWLPVCIDPSYPPFQMTDARGQLAGYDIELVEEVAGHLGVQTRYVAVDVGGMLDALITRSCDVAVGGLQVMPEYGRDLAFSRPYFDAGLVLIHRTDVARDMLSGRQVAYESGSSADLYREQVQAQLDGVHLVPTMSLESIRDRLASGEVAGAVLDAVTASELARDLPTVTIDAERLTSESFVLVLRKRDRLLRSAIDDQVAVMAATGWLERLEAKWLTHAF
ncbi:MAG: amino acid ABC transporter substrate-binding protein [Chloroflexi bacterium]|nr:amino acid ABC transporter substrate-binding protein [Chloroflexota bacterium]